MIDTQVRPVYDDSPFCAGLCLGEYMYVNGVALTPDLIRSYLLDSDLMPWVTVCKRDDLRQMVEKRHGEMGGKRSEAKSPSDQFGKVLSQLVKGGQLSSPHTDHYERVGTGLMDIPTQSSAGGAAEQEAEVVVGEGRESVYGWYLPIYRKLAERQGQQQFPVKVGRTERDVQGRMREAIGTVPEPPVLGFVLRVDDSAQCEKFFHSSLCMRGRKIEEAIGDEWFSVTLEELRDLALEALALIASGQQEDHHVAASTR